MFFAAFLIDKGIISAVRANVKAAWTFVPELICPDDDLHA